MKKFLTVANLVKLLAVAAGVASFCFMFGDQLGITALGVTAYVSWQDALFGVKTALVNVKGATLSFVGYLLIAGGALFTCANLFVTDKKANRFLPAINALLFIVGGVFVVLEASLFNSANGAQGLYYLATAPIIAAILAFVAAIGDLVAIFLAQED